MLLCSNYHDLILDIWDLWYHELSGVQMPQEFHSHMYVFMYVQMKYLSRRFLEASVWQVVEKQQSHPHLSLTHLAAIFGDAISLSSSPKHTELIFNRIAETCGMYHGNPTVGSPNRENVKCPRKFVFRCVSFSHIYIYVCLFVKCPLPIQLVRRCHKWLSNTSPYLCGNGVTSRSDSAF